MLGDVTNTLLLFIYIYIYIICTAEIAGDTYSAHFFKIDGWSIFEG